MNDGTHRWLATDVLMTHQRRDSSSCLCGWSDLGKSHPEHVAAALEQAGALRTDDRAPVTSEGVPVRFARGVSDNSWLHKDEFAWFLEGYQYARNQTLAISALSKVSPEEMFYAVVAIMRGAGLGDPEDEPGSSSRATVGSATDVITVEYLIEIHPAAAGIEGDWRDDPRFDRLLDFAGELFGGWGVLGAHGRRRGSDG